MGSLQPDQTAGAVAATEAASPLPGAASTRSAVNQLLKSPVREICTPGSVGTGGGRPPPVTRWARGNSRPYRDASGQIQSFHSGQYRVRSALPQLSRLLH